MEKKIKQKEIHFLVSEDEYAVIKGKADSAGMKVGQYVREMAINGKIQPITNGKEIARQMGMIQGNFIKYHNNMMERVDALNNAVEANNELLGQYSNKNISHSFIETLQLQQNRISTVIGMIKTAYGETYRVAQEDVMRSLNPIVRR
ncbi:MAG: hypothetical protein J6O04_09780 [Selenomonadaceae bacterium]|nr:hypothetical protein [Selenomonadaceae bacterium]